MTMKAVCRNPSKLAVVAAALLGAAVVARATPYFSLQSDIDWSAALGSGEVKPVSPVEWSDWKALNPDFYPLPYTSQFVQPELYVYGGGGGGAFEEPGLVMAWGEAGTTDYTAAWKYEYGLDPNLAGSTLWCNVLPPQFGGLGQINGVGLGLVDVAGNTRTWSWNCAAVPMPATSTIAWNQPWNLSIGPISGVVAPAGPGPLPPWEGPAFANNGAVWVPPVYFSSAGFNPAFTQSIIFIENGQTVGQIPPPPGAAFIPVLWNFWRNAGIIPEPGTLAMLAAAMAGAVLSRRR